MVEQIALKIPPTAPSDTAPLLLTPLGVVVAGAEVEGVTVTIEVDGATVLVGGVYVETEIVDEDAAETEVDEMGGTTTVELAGEALDRDPLADGVADADWDKGVVEAPDTVEPPAAVDTAPVLSAIDE